MHWKRASETEVFNDATYGAWRRFLWVLINSVLRMSPSSNELCQFSLFNPGPVDGVFDRSTQAAAARFYKSRGYVMTPNLGWEYIQFLETNRHRPLSRRNLQRPRQ